MADGAAWIIFEDARYLAKLFGASGINEIGVRFPVGFIDADLFHEFVVADDEASAFIVAYPCSLKQFTFSEI